jgi:hypothetical protein
MTPPTREPRRFVIGGNGPRELTEFDVMCLARAAEKRERKAALLRAREAA